MNLRCALRAARIIQASSDKDKTARGKKDDGGGEVRLGEIIRKQIPLE